MPRYLLQEQDPSGNWADTDIFYSTKQQLNDHIGVCGHDYEWRVGFFFKPFNKKPSRFVWKSGSKKGEEVQV